MKLVGLMTLELKREGMRVSVGLGDTRREGAGRARLNQGSEAQVRQRSRSRAYDRAHGINPKSRLARLRLAAQRLTPETAAAGPVDAARAVIGVQAQDVRASGLSLRSRVTGLEREAVLADPGLLRTWTVRGTVHLIAADDLPWLHAVTAPRNRARYEGLMTKRGNDELVRALLPDILATLEERGPMTRAALIDHLLELGHPPLDQSSSNILMPWIAVTGRIAGLPDGRFRATDPPKPVDEDEALSTLGRRYLAGYGPAGPADLARWSGLTLATAKRALDSCGPLEAAGDDLLALPGTLDAGPPPAPPALLLAAFDTALLGWRSREPLVAAADDANVLPGGGIVKATVLSRGRATATWRVEGSGSRRTLVLAHFGRPPARRALAAEAADVGRFLGLHLTVAS